MAKFEHEPNRRIRFRCFYEALKDAGNKHIGKTNPGKKTKAWLTPTVRGKIQMHIESAATMLGSVPNGSKHARRLMRQFAKRKRRVAGHCYEVPV